MQAALESSDAPAVSPQSRLSAIGRAIARGRPGRWLDALLLVLAVVSACAIGQLLGLFAPRLPYPFELEWMEGGVVDHVRIVLRGEPLYREPSLAFTPFIYPPFYYYLAALLSRVIGVGFLAPRLISALSTLGTLGIIAALVRREGGGRLPALVGAGLFALTFELNGKWMDVARVDSLFVFLLLLGSLLSRGISRRAAVACGVVLFLAFFTKQTALTLALPALASFLIRDRRRGVLAAVVYGVLVAGSIVGMNHATNGWFGYYVFKVPSEHPLRWADWRGLLDPFWVPVAVPVLFALLSIVFGLPAPRAIASLFVREARSDVALRERVSTFVLYAGLLAATFVTGYSSLLHADGFANVLMPFHAALSLTAALGLALVLRDAEPEARVLRLRAFAALALLLHCGSLAFDPRRHLPTQKDVAAGRAMIERLRARPGSVLMLGTGYYPALAGRPEVHAHAMALCDVFKTRPGPIRDGLLRSLEGELRAKTYAGIVVDDVFTFFPPTVTTALHQSYRIEGYLFTPSEANLALPKTGFLYRPNAIWVPR